MSIVELLNLKRFPDLARLGQGYVALHQPEIGQFSYKIAVNDPLSSDSIEKIVVFASGTDPGLIRQLYQLCNGLWVARFGVFGLRSGPWGLQQPWDINVPNYFERPASLPSDYLIVGTSFEIDVDGTELKFSHVIIGDGRVVVVELETSGKIWREYCSIEEWLKKEAERALDDQSKP